MTINFGNPLTSQLRVDVMSSIRDAQAALSMLLDPAYAGTVTAPPTGAKRITGSTGAAEMFNGSSWVAMALNGVRYNGGNVGVGITPAAPFHVLGVESRFQGDSAYHSFYNAAGTRRGYLQFAETATLLNTESAVPMLLYTSSAERLRIDATPGHITPGANNAQNFGSASLRLANVYSVLGNFSGLITASAGVSGNLAGNADTATTAAQVANALTAGSYLTSAGTFTGAAARTFAVDATSANTASKVVARDASGNFAAGTVTVNVLASAGGAGISFNPNGTNRVNLDTSGDMAPAANETQRLGSTSLRWMQIHMAQGGLRPGNHISRFESAEQTCPSTSAVLSVSHGGSRVPDMFCVVLRCKAAELGFTAGDELNYTTFLYEQSSPLSVAETAADATNLVWTFSRAGTAPVVLPKDGGAYSAVNASNWRIVFRAIWL